ncbi:MAG: nucleotidyltransferase domain-containing protein [Thaumarchaeota archaeon]|nr:nucleotidyltransferase domain-containing protein [Nitrososphaerota archaeon]
MNSGGIDEPDKLKELAEELGKGRLYALCVYGSKVAGYARPESDYDLIVVLDGFREGIRYKYVDEPVTVSAILVDKKAMESDAKSARLGEFVVGRLLNVYEPLVNPEFFRRLEVEYKTRVIEEEVYRIVSEYGELAKELLIHIDYFLFSRLKSRSGFYPPALYSYVMTYGGPLKERNLKATRSGFVEAADRLVEMGLLERDGDYVRILEAERSSWIKALSIHTKMTVRSITHYLVHGYAGRVKPSVVVRELASKLGRSAQIGEVPRELKNPKCLWKLAYGELITGEEWVEELAKLLGFDEYEVKEEGPKEFYSTTTLLTLKGGGREERLVVKRFRDPMSLKWLALNIWALASKKFDLTPLARLKREYMALKAFRELGICTKELVAVDLEDRILVSRYMEGRDLGSVVKGILSGAEEGLELVERYGELMAKIHSSCYYLGDSKPSNVIIHDGRLCIVDLEQAGRGGDKAWDIAEFLYYSMKLTLNSKSASSLVKAFLKGYMKHGSKELVRKVTGVKYVRPFEPFVSPNILASVVRTIKEETE